MGRVVAVGPGDDCANGYWIVICGCVSARNAQNESYRFLLTKLTTSITRETHKAGWMIRPVTLGQ